MKKPICIDCGAPADALIGGIPLCDDCYSQRGSCCPEFGAADLTSDEDSGAYASPPCFAHEKHSRVEIHRDPDIRRFQLAPEAYLKYEQTGNEFIITHTYVPESMHGKGVGSQLIQAAIEFAEANKLSVRATCPFAAAYLAMHPNH